MPWFTFTDASGESFAFRLTDPARIAEALAILDGTQTDAIHVAGTVVKSPAPGNIGWSYHLDPASIFFFEVSTEVGDSTMRYIEAHLAEVGGAFLPGSVWTGWSSELTGQLAVRRGTAAADHVLGTPRADLLFAGEGHDTAAGGAGNDHLVGGAGDDWLRGNAGDDRLSGLSGNDTLSGGAGNDALLASRDDSTLRGGDGADTFIVWDPGSLGRVVIRDFDPLAAGERIHLGRDWLMAIGDLSGDGRVNRHDLLLAFSERDGDLVLRHDAGTELVLKDLSPSEWKVSDFLIL